jgi:hypothetical protein
MTRSELQVFVRWFEYKTAQAINRGDDRRAGQFARGLTHFAKNLQTGDYTPSETSQSATEGLHN